MSYGIFASKEEHDAWMRSWIETQNDLADLNHRVIQRQKEIAAESIGEGLSGIVSQDHKEVLEKAMTVLGQAVALMAAIVKGMK